MDALTDQLAEALSQLLDRLSTHGSIDPVREEGPINDAEIALADYERRRDGYPKTE